MARKTVVELIDDIDGRPAEETVSFALDGVAYEIDLSSTNADLLRDGIAPYLAKARRAGSTTAARQAAAPRAAGTAARTPDRSAEIRAWARAEGLTVNERGRIPARVVAAFESRGSEPRDVEAQNVEPQGVEPQGVESGGFTAGDAEPDRPQVPQATFQSVVNP